MYFYTTQQLIQRYPHVNFSAKKAAKFKPAKLRAEKWSEEDVRMWHAFRSESPGAIAARAFSRLTDIQAQAVVLLNLALKPGKGTRDYIPPYAMPIIHKLTGPVETERPVKVEAIETLLKRGGEILKPWRKKGGGSSQTIAALRELGHKAKDIANALGLREGAISKARRRVGLEASQSRQLQTSNRTVVANIQPLATEQLSEILSIRGVTDEIPVENRDSFFALPAHVQQAFRIDSRLRRESHPKIPSYRLIAEAFNNEYGTKISREVLHQKIDLARNALGIEQALTERLNKSSARAQTNEPIFRKLARKPEFKKLPTNWSPGVIPTPDETEAAEKLFKKHFKSSLPHRLIYHLYCEDSKRANKQIAWELKQRHGIEIGAATVSTYITSVKRVLGIQSNVTGVNRLATSALVESDAFQAKLSPELPALGGQYKYSDAQRAGKIWRGEITLDKPLTDYEKALFQCFAGISTEQTTDVLRGQLASRYKRDFNPSGTLGREKILYAACRRARIKLGLAETELQKKATELNTFNAQNQKQARTLPDNWKANMSGLDAKSDTEALAAFLKLPPIKRILFTLHCAFVDPTLTQIKGRKDTAAFIRWFSPYTAKYLQQFNPEQDSHCNTIRDYVHEARIALAKETQVT